MSAPQIGIYLADHTFFPVFTDSLPGKKRVLLSTTHAGQECVDVVLIRRDPEFPAGEQRLGNVLLCDIAGGNPDESAIEVVLQLHEDGRFDASARDRLSGNTRDVSFDPAEAVPQAYAPEEFDDFTAPSVDRLFDDSEPTTSKPARRGRWLWILLALIVLGALAFALVRFFGTSGTDTSPETVSETSNTSTAADTDANGSAADDMGAVDSDTDRVRDAGADATALVEESAPVAEPDSPLTETGQIEPYQIRWGDTLWDISRMFYGTPWRFSEIADENNIADPDRIYADEQIRIPER